MRDDTQAGTRLEADLLVLGHGPAAAAAAHEGARRGGRVLLVQERPAPAPAHPGIRVRPGRLVWSVTPGFQVHALGPDGLEAYAAPRLVVETGLVERVTPFPGWDLGFVADLDAAVPGGRVVVAGCGPRLLFAAARLAAAGAHVVAVADLASAGEWLRASLHLPPPLVARCAAARATLLRHGVPLLSRHAVLRAEPGRVRLGPVDAAGAPWGSARWLAAGALRVGHGVVPDSRVLRLLRVPHRFVPAQGGWVPVLGPGGGTAVPGLSAVGPSLSGGGCRADAALARLTRPRPGLLAAMPDDTPVCLCEGLVRADLDAAIGAGAREMNQLKQFTRCGMGRCAGRACAEAAAGLLALRVGGREAAGQWTVRPPLRPMPLDALVGAFTYADIPVPAPAPL